MNISHLSDKFSHHPDAKYLLSDPEHGFKPGMERLPTQNIICDNLQSALTEPDKVINLIKKEVELGFTIIIFKIPLFNCFHIIPIGVATRPHCPRTKLKE